MIVESNGELTPEIEIKLNSFEIEDKNKIDAYKFFLDKAKLWTSFLDTKEKDIKSHKNGWKRLIEFLNTNLKVALNTRGLTQLHGNEYYFKLVPTQPALVIEEDILPAEWTKEITQYVPDRDKIKLALDAGTVIPGAKLVKSFALRSYPIRADKIKSDKKEIKELTNE